MWRTAATITLIATLAGCSSSSTSDDNTLPSGVNAAFAAEHPTAKTHDTKEVDRDGDKAYVVPYTLPDGAKGQATYSSAGVLVDGK